MAFQTLPIELVEKIATYLPQDQDLCTFTLICHQTQQAVRHVQSGVWRKRFASKYDVPPGKTGCQMRVQYQARQVSLNKDIHFRSGRKVDEQAQLKFIRELILESFIDAAREAKPFSKNMEQLHYFCRRSNILQCVLQTDHSKAHGLLQTVQLMFFPWSLDFSMNYPTISFPASQQIVYSHPETIPLFLDKHKTRVNISFLLHITNFFKYHMSQPQEATLFFPFQDLEDNEKPKIWQNKLEQGIRKLGKSWKGSYAYLHDLRDVPIMRSLEAYDHVIVDSIDHHDDGFQSLQLDFSPENCTPWPAVFDEQLNSFPTPSLLRKLRKDSGDTNPRKSVAYPSPPSTPAVKSRVNPTAKPQPGIDYLQFSGTGIDADPYFCTGIIHALPPQHGIPGFQRITMMKIMPPDMSSTPSTTSDPFLSSSDNAGGGGGVHPLPGGLDVTGILSAELDESCWAYEGVVLPGGMIILGRWWSPADDTVDMLGTGPFIFWNVEDD